MKSDTGETGGLVRSEAEFLSSCEPGKPDQSGASNCTGGPGAGRTCPFRRGEGLTSAAGSRGPQAPGDLPPRLQGTPVPWLGSEAGLPGPRQCPDDL